MHFEIKHQTSITAIIEYEEFPVASTKYYDKTQFGKHIIFNTIAL